MSDRGSSNKQSRGTGSAFDEYEPRQKLAAMLLRAEIDEDFANSLRGNPEELFTRAGLDATQSRALMDVPQSRGPADVLGRGSCFDTTCVASICPTCCNISTPAIPGICTESGATTVSNLVSTGTTIASFASMI
jgi:hypothetical protein